MKKYRYLGVSSGRCCVLSSLASFDSLSEHRNEIEANDFVYEDATNWGGSDDIERTLRVKGIRQTGRKIVLPHSVLFSGTDYDMGHEYGWTFKVDEIWELKEVGL